MNPIDFQNAKIKLAKSILDIENEALLRKIQNCLQEEKIEVIENKPTFKRREERRTEYQAEQRKYIEDVDGVRKISANDFVIKLS
jgi:hypothetical protein